MALFMSTRMVSGILIVDCAGRLALGDETTKFREFVHPLLLPNGRLTLNLEHITHIDSGGLGALVGLHTSASTRAVRMNLAGLNRRVLDLLNLTKLSTIFEIHPTVEDAAEALRG